MSKNLIGVLVVDDHPIVRSGLCTQINLDAGMRVVGEAEDGEEAVEKARALKPDVILMDIVMPIKDGIEATREIIADNPDACILILTSFQEDERLLAVMKAGAMGFILKDRRPEELIQAIRDVHRGDPFMPPSFTRRFLRDLREQHRAEPQVTLTEREKEILVLVAQGDPYKEIARKINLREPTVRTHVSNILKKLNLSNRSQLTVYAINHKMVNL